MRLKLSVKIQYFCFYKITYRFSTERYATYQSPKRNHLMGGLVRTNVKTGLSGPVLDTAGLPAHRVQVITHT